MFSRLNLQFFRLFLVICVLMSAFFYAPGVYAAKSVVVDKQLNYFNSESGLTGGNTYLDGYFFVDEEVDSKDNYYNIGIHRDYYLGKTAAVFTSSQDYYGYRVVFERTSYKAARTENVFFSRWLCGTKTDLLNGGYVANYDDIKAERFAFYVPTDHAQVQILLAPLFYGTFNVDASVSYDIDLDFHVTVEGFYNQSEYQDSLNSLSNKIESQNKEMQNQTNEMKEQNAELDKQTNELKDMNYNVNNELNTQTSEMQEQNAELDRQTSQMQQQNAELDKQTSILEGMDYNLNTELNSQTSELKDQNAELDKQTGVLEDMNYNLNTELNSQTSEMQEQNAELDKQTAELTESNNNLKILQNGYDTASGDLMNSSFTASVEGYQTSENSLFSAATSGLNSFALFNFTSIPALVTALSLVSSVMTSIYVAMGGENGPMGIVLSVLFSVMLVSMAIGLYRFYVTRGKGKGGK